MLPESQSEKYQAFYDATASHANLDPKTTVMVQLAAAFVAGCYP